MIELLIETTHGKVRGKQRDGHQPTGVWRGIPYARPPVGTLRFRPPQPAEPWTGERDATALPAAAMQSRDPRISTMSGITDKIATSEDCLTLNVFSPGTDGAPRPVVVWIHGGAFIMGTSSTPLYDGRTFAANHDLVVVTLNYRLGMFGFLYLGDLAPDHDAGNYALLDQIAALQWVKANIAAFGGDPNNVTLMGESAGAVSVATVLAMPAARGLFHRAILQSGASGLSPPTRTDATAIATNALGKLGCTVGELAELPADRFIAAQLALSVELGLAAFAPYVDGVTIPAPPTEVVRAGNAAVVPLLLGSNRNEWSLFEVFLGASLDGYKAPLRDRFGAATFDRIFTAYGERWSDIVGEVVFRIPMIRLAEAMTAHQRDVYMYRFDWASPAFNGKLGATHALELPFMWNQIEQPLSQILLGGDLAGARPLATAMHATWAAFIRGGDPNGAGLPAWPRYDRTRRATMILDRESRVEDDPARETREVWPS